jgi:serine/threonine protein kinase/ankyrin repeat protein
VYSYHARKAAVATDSYAIKPKLDRCDTLRFLYALGAKLDVQNDNGETALHLAAKNGSVGAVIWLVEKEPNLVRKVNKLSKDAEAIARDAGRIEAAKVLQEAKQQKKKATKNATEFQKVLSRGENLVTIKDWLDRLSGSDVVFLIDSPNTKTGTNGFLEACAGGDFEVCKFLLSFPGKRNTRNEKTGASALHIAAGRGHTAIVELLLHELDLDPSRTDAKGITPIQEASKGGHMECARVLREYEDKKHSSIARPISRSSFEHQESTSSTVPSTPPRQTSDGEISSSTDGQSSNLSNMQRFPSSGSMVSLSAPTEPITMTMTVAPPTPAPIDPDLLVLLEKVSLGLGWGEKLREQGFETMNNLLHILEDDLKELGMTKGHRRALLHELDLIKAEQKLSKQRISNPLPTSPMDGMKYSNSMVRNAVSRLEPAGPSAPLSFADLRKFRISLEELQQHPVPEMENMTQIELIVPASDPRQEPKAFVLTRRDNIYSCSCASWKFQLTVPEEERSCEHLKLLRGEKAERLRVDIGSHGIVSKRLSTGSSALRRPSSSAGGNNSSSLSETNRRTLTEMRRLRTEHQQQQQMLWPDVPSHFIVKWEELSVEDIIGEGSFGVVRVATWRGMKVAVKELKIGTTIGNPREEFTDLKREAITMARVCNHDNVVPLVGMVLEPVPSVIMTFMPGGSVEDLLVLPGPRSIRKYVKWFAVLKMLRDAAAGVLHLHCQGVIHRDLSARNLLVDSTGAVRVADFGFARIKDDNLSKGYTVQHVGPIKWMSPEALRLKKFSEKSDVFAFGVTMWEIIKGQRPWPGKDSMDVVFRVCSGERMKLPENCPNDTIPNLIALCWSQEERERPTMKELLNELDLAWKDAGGPSELDPSGGVAALIKGEAFQRPPVFSDEEPSSSSQGHTTSSSAGGEGFLSNSVIWQANGETVVQMKDDDGYSRFTADDTTTVTGTIGGSRAWGGGNLFPRGVSPRASDEKINEDDYVPFKV